MKRKIADAFPYYDTNALDSARFLYGNDSDEVEFYEGNKTILDYLEEDDFADFDASLEQVPEGQRNSTMSHIAEDYQEIRKYRGRLINFSLRRQNSVIRHFLKVN